MPLSAAPAGAVNCVVLAGRLVRPAETQVLPSEATLVRLEVRVELPAAPAETVPVVWFDPPAWPATLDAGAEVVVVGRVRRRFFRAGGATQSRTEVVVERAARARTRRRAALLVQAAAAGLEAAAADLADGGGQAPPYEPASPKASTAPSAEVSQ
ncbi:MAG TPA: hypothetical protein VFP61_15710 [Acidimicrobiales bacterium]|nr:hypothetical protein [Acidimicrobiales bacterium]